ncbi:MAG: ATP-binding protein [Campylobacterota bacterium]|nr:ATP-binding protein [Campylobacterota bacterium]
MVKLNENNIGKFNLFSTFFILIAFAIFVIYFSISSKLDDFELIKAQATNKFIEEKKKSIKSKINIISNIIDQTDFKDQNKIKELVNNINKENIKEYIFISKLHNIDGGKDFASLIVHPTAKLGGFISTGKKDIYGKDYRSVYLNGLKENNEVFLNYSYINPITKKEMSKISYFILNKKWNWIIATGFHDDIMDEEINNWQEHLNILVKDNVYVHISLLFLFSMVLLLVVYMINKFTNNTIEEYKESVFIKEKQLNELNNNLENRIKKEIEKSKQQEQLILEQTKMVALADMMNNIAHQWRQPLSVISTAATGMKVKKEYGISEEEDELSTLDTIDKSAQYLSKTIDNFRDFLEGDDAKVDFYIHNIIDKALEIEENNILKYQIDVVKEYDKDILIYNISHGLLQVLVNIISNATDALEKNNKNERHLFIKTNNSLKDITITITDTGGGIETNLISRIFEPYFTTKHKSQGTGLGLHMAYNIITQNMTGKISVENITFEYQDKQYTGASFKIILNKTDKKIDE